MRSSRVVVGPPTPDALTARTWKYHTPSALPVYEAPRNAVPRNTLTVLSFMSVVIMSP